jgi:hypothetical protein
VLPLQLADLLDGSADNWTLFTTVIAPWLPLALIPVVIALLAAAAILRGAPLVSTPVMAPALVAAAVAQTFVWGVLLPGLKPVWVSSNLVAAARAAAPCPDPRLVAVGYREPSMIFLAGTDTLLASPHRAAEAAAAEGCAVVAVEEEDLAAFRDAAAARSLPLREASVVEGFNISKGDPVRLTLFLRD